MRPSAMAICPTRWGLRLIVVTQRNSRSQPMVDHAVEIGNPPVERGFASRSSHAKMLPLWEPPDEAPVNSHKTGTRMSMSTKAKKPAANAAPSKRLAFKVRDLALAELGRKEI